MGNKVSKRCYNLDDETKNKIVYGYIRNCQELRSKKKPYLQVPSFLYDNSILKSVSSA